LLLRREEHYLEPRYTALFQDENGTSILRNLLEQTSRKIAVVPDTGQGLSKHMPFDRKLHSILVISMLYLAGNILRNTVQQLFPNSTLAFSSEEQVDSYVANKRYANFPDVPGLWAVIILTTVPVDATIAGEWAYTIRMNATSGRFGSFDYQGVPDTADVKQTDNLQV